MTNPQSGPISTPEPEKADTPKPQPLGKALGTTLPRLLKAILPDQPTINRFLRAAYVSTKEIPQLEKCTESSFILAVAQAALLKLELGSARGLAYVLPYRVRGVYTAKLLVGYKGLVLLGRRAGLLDWQGRAVRERDEFDYEYGNKPFVHHKPYRGGEAERGPLSASYSVAWIHADLPANFRVLEGPDVLRRRDVSKNTDGAENPWNMWPEEMWMKSAMRAHANQLATDESLSAALELEDRAALGEDQVGYHAVLDEIVVPDTASENQNAARQTIKDQLAARKSLGEGQAPAQPITIKTPQPVVQSAEDAAIERAELDRQARMDQEGAP